MGVFHTWAVAETGMEEETRMAPPGLSSLARNIGLGKRVETPRGARGLAPELRRYPYRAEMRDGSEI